MPAKPPTTDELNECEKLIREGKPLDLDVVRRMISHVYANPGLPVFYVHSKFNSYYTATLDDGPLPTDVVPHVLHQLTRMEGSVWPSKLHEWTTRIKACEGVSVEAFNVEWLELEQFLRDNGVWIG